MLNAAVALEAAVMAPPRQEEEVGVVARPLVVVARLRAVVARAAEAGVVVVPACAPAVETGTSPSTAT
jgi:hypothetical protein